MKIRLGFVTNSSSSSFICEACGDTTSGWDLCLSDSFMSECENGHIVCNCHIDVEEHKEALEKRFYEETKIILEERKDTEVNLFTYLIENNTTIEDILKLSVEEIEDLFQSKLNWSPTIDANYMYEKEYISIEKYPSEGFFKEMCPICMHDTVTDYELISFATEKLGITREELVELAREALIAKDNK